MWGINLFCHTHPPPPQKGLTRLLTVYYLHFQSLISDTFQLSQILHGGKPVECGESKRRDTSFPWMASLPDRQYPHAWASNRKQGHQPKHSEGRSTQNLTQTTGWMEYQASRCPLMLRSHLLPTTTWVVSLHCCPFLFIPLQICFLWHFAYLISLFT